MYEPKESDPSSRTALYRVPSRGEFDTMDVRIDNVSFDSVKQNTMMIFSIGGEVGEGAEIEVEFRNKSAYFAGAPDMVVLYNEKKTDLGTVYSKI